MPSLSYGIDKGTSYLVEAGKLMSVEELIAIPFPSSPQRQKERERMAKFLSDGVKHQFVPEDYIFPPSKRPGIHVNTCEQVPVIHLTRDDQLDVSNQILSAGKEFGFFQVVDHGIPEEVISDMIEVTKEFFNMSVKEKALYYSEDPTKVPRLYTSQGYNLEETRYWRDCLRLVYYGPGDEFTHLYPEKPSRFRNVVAQFTAVVEGLAARILELISKGLGLGDDYFSGNFSKGPIRMNVNHYPPCPDPSLTLGLPKHCDPNLITLLLQGNVSGLQVLYGGEWVQVNPIPNAFVVNFGHVLEIVTNGLLKSVEHRAVTNASVARTTIATFIVPTEDCLIAPAPCKHSNPPLYRSFPYTDFFGVYMANVADRERTMEAFMIKN